MRVIALNSLAPNPPSEQTPGLNRQRLSEIVELFPEEIRRRGVNRAYHEYDHALGLLERLRPPIGPGFTVLDVGAGAGVIPLVLARCGAQVHAVDTWTEYAAGHNNQMGTREQILARLAENQVCARPVDVLNEPLPYPESNFDLVTMFAVLEHLHGSPAEVLAKIRHVLKPGGHLVLSTPNIACLHNRLRLLMGRTIHFPVNTWYHERPFTGHVREYTRDELKQVVGYAGLRFIGMDLSESPRHNTRLANGRWRPGFQLNSWHQFLKLLYFACVQVIPALRYSMMVIAQKP